MKATTKVLPRCFWEGALYTLISCSLILSHVSSFSFTRDFLLRFGGIAVLAIFGLFSLRRFFNGMPWGKLCCMLFGGGILAAARSKMGEDPFAALFFGGLLVAGAFALTENDDSVPSADPEETARQRCTGAGLICIALPLFSLFFDPEHNFSAWAAQFCCGGCALWFFFCWLRLAKLHHCLEKTGLGLIFAVLCLFLLTGPLLKAFLLPLFCIGAAISAISGFFHPRNIEKLRGWDLFLLHPARSMFFSFLLLSFLGTLLLSTPAATRREVSGIDTVFIAVSAGCVTGLSPLNVGESFTTLGQFFILLLIQCGGLGVMTIASIAFYAVGRLSLNQENMMNQVTDTGSRSLKDSMQLIFLFTFIAEGIGALILALHFFCVTGMTAAAAFWNGVFCAVSAFCNAGFSLWPDSLAGFTADATVLNVIALECILGGVAPAVCLFFPRFLLRKTIPLSAFLAISTTLILLLVSWTGLLLFEWNGILGHLPWPEKLLNGWFQSSTMRTAGFNSVPVEYFSDAAYLLALVMMFIGGCPGGTAGGIKTTTVAVLVLTFWSVISGKEEIIVHKRHVRYTVIYRAVTMLMAAFAVLGIMAVMLLATQEISGRLLIFEAVSALATVGLSIGATPQLDSIGKLIVILTMFIGRIGPMTIFMILNDPHRSSVSRYPDGQIILS